MRWVFEGMRVRASEGGFKLSRGVEEGRNTNTMHDSR